MNLPTLKAKFIYAGYVRHVENVTLEPDKDTLIGMEVRKGGKFSYKIKRYSMAKVLQEGDIDFNDS